MNGNLKLVYWILGVLGMIVVGGAGFWMNSIQTKLDSMSNIAAASQLSNSARLSALETILPYVTQRLDTIDRKLDRVEEQSRKK